MIQIASNSGTEQDLKDAMIANGIQPEEVAAPTGEAKPEGDKKSAAPGEPGEKVPAETGKESEPTTDAGKDNSQKEPPEEPVVTEPVVTEVKPKAKGGFQAKLETKTRQL